MSPCTMSSQLIYSSDHRLCKKNRHWNRSFQWMTAHLNLAHLMHCISTTHIASKFQKLFSFSKFKPFMDTHKVLSLSCSVGLVNGVACFNQLTAVGVPLQTSASFHIDVIAFLSLQAVHWILCLEVNGSSLTYDTTHKWQSTNLW